jgi:hypothetical protein
MYFKDSSEGGSILNKSIKTQIGKILFRRGRQILWNSVVVEN